MVALKPFKASEIIERCPTMEINETDVGGALAAYAFPGHRVQGGEGTAIRAPCRLLVLGYANLYRSVPCPNVWWSRAPDGDYVYRASRVIAQGEELLVNYDAAEVGPEVGPGLHQADPEHWTEPNGGANSEASLVQSDPELPATSSHAAHDHALSHDGHSGASLETCNSSFASNRQPHGDISASLSPDSAAMRRHEVSTNSSVSCAPKCSDRHSPDAKSPDYEAVDWDKAVQVGDCLLHDGLGLLKLDGGEPLPLGMAMGKSAVHGRGMFATRAFKENDVVEVCVHVCVGSFSVRQRQLWCPSQPQRERLWWSLSSWSQ